MPAATLTGTDLAQHFKLLSKGKVRDLYEISDDTILFIATDRISAFDVVRRGHYQTMMKAQACR